MPVDFQCASCHCRFSVGGYHYHRFQDGYAGQTLAVCRSCGTRHAIERALADRGPPTYPLLRVLVSALQPEARSPTARWLRRDRNVSYSEALELVRHPPFVLFENTYEHKAESVRKELEAFGATLVVEKVGEEPNPMFGPVQTDRVRFAPSGPESRPTWLLASVKVTRRELEHLDCAGCHAHGTLTADPEDLTACPACKESALVETGAWVT